MQQKAPNGFIRGFFRELFLFLFFLFKVKAGGEAVFFLEILPGQPLSRKEGKNFRIWSNIGRFLLHALFLLRG